MLKGITFQGKPITLRPETDYDQLVAERKRMIDRSIKTKVKKRPYTNRVVYTKIYTKEEIKLMETNAYKLFKLLLETKVPLRARDMMDYTQVKRGSVHSVLDNMKKTQMVVMEKKGGFNHYSIHPSYSYMNPEQLCDTMKRLSRKPAKPAPTKPTIEELKLKEYVDIPLHTPHKIEIVFSGKVEIIHRIKIG